LTILFVPFVPKLGTDKNRQHKNEKKFMLIKKSRKYKKYCIIVTTQIFTFFEKKYFEKMKIGQF
jgi:hypothetical protein